MQHFIWIAINLGKKKIFFSLVISTLCSEKYTESEYRKQYILKLILAQ
jgi:hypothetical protein